MPPHPDLVLPVLRPSRTRGEVGSWMRDESAITRMEARLKPCRHVALGEYHGYGADTCTPERWFYVDEHARCLREWLADLPRDVAERIAWRTVDTLFTFTSMRARLAP